MGIVYASSENVGYEAIIESWKKRAIPNIFSEAEEMEVEVLIDWLIWPTIKQIFTKQKMIFPMKKQCLIHTLLSIFEDSIRIFENQEIYNSYD